MIQIHLQNQFSRIHSHFSGKNVETTLQYMADVLCCTKRNARIVLNKMTDQGWLHWQPMAGRSNQSSLQFFCSVSDIQKQQIADWFRAGKLKSAFEESSYDKQNLIQFIIEHLGSFNKNGISILRLADSRPAFCFEQINPIDKIEFFILKLVFNGLTRLNGNSGEIEADLAHRWIMITPQHWRFFLHSDVRLHDNSKLVVDDVISSIMSITQFPFFSHIQNVISPAINVIDFFLSKSDYHLHKTLSQPQAMIYRRKEVVNEKNDILLGTGSYFIKENSYKRLYLKRHDSFFGQHYLIDEIDIWLFNERSVNFDIEKRELNAKLTKRFDQLAKDKSVILENGSIILWLNRVSGVAKNNDWGAFLSQLFYSTKMVQHFEQLNEMQSIIPALGLLPKWHQIIESPFELRPPNQQNLKLAYPSHDPLFSKIASLLKYLLSKEGVALELKEVSFEEIMNFQHHEDIDIWLSHAVFGSDEEDEILTWLIGHQYLNRVMPFEEIEQAKTLLQQWRSQEIPTFSSSALAERLISQHQIIPLFHQWINKNDFLSFISNKSPKEVLASLWCSPIEQENSHSSVLPIIEGAKTD